MAAETGIGKITGILLTTNLLRTLLPMPQVAVVQQEKEALEKQLASSEESVSLSMCCTYCLLSMVSSSSGCRLW